MNAGTRRTSASTAAWIGLAGLASAMGIGRFAFTPLLPLMQHEGGIALAQGASLAAANYLGYLVGALACMVVSPAPHRAAVTGLLAVAPLTAGMGLSETFGVWFALRLLAGAASAFVLVGVSAWALPLLAAEGRPSWSGRVYAGVGVGIFLTGLVGLGAGLMGRPAAHAWLLLGGSAALVALAVWRPMTTPLPLAARPSGTPSTLPAGAWRPALCYGAFGFGYIIPATFLPAAARQLMPDPAVFGWTWPVFGLAAAASTAASSRWRQVPPRRLWAGAQAIMAVGVLAPAIRMSASTLLFSAVCVGGTFMVVTMAGMQEARAVAGPSAARLMAAMTAAFAIGQLVGPFTVNLLRSAAHDALALSHAVAAGVLLLGILVLSPRAQAGPCPALPHEEGARR
jgi:hypothetical protein